MLSAGCQRYTNAGGKRHIQLLPVKDKVNMSAMDMGRYIKMQFDLAAHTHKQAYLNGKRVVAVVDGQDLRSMSKSGAGYYVYFWNPYCPQTRKDIQRLDSLCSKGANVVVLSLRNDLDVISKRLEQTSFGRYPIYVVAEKYSTKELLMRKLRLIKEACAGCYEQYRDDLAVADYLLIENETILPVFYNDKDRVNILADQ